MSRMSLVALDEHTTLGVYVCTGCQKISTRCLYFAPYDHDCDQAAMQAWITRRQPWEHPEEA